MNNYSELYRFYTKPSEAKIASFNDICNYRAQVLAEWQDEYDFATATPVVITSANCFSYVCEFTVNVDEYSTTYHFTRKYLTITTKDIDGVVETRKEDNPFERLNLQWYF